MIKHTAARAPAAAARRAGGRLPQLQRPRGADRRSRAAGDAPIRCWCCRMPARSAARACPSGACCRFPKKLLAQGVRDMVRISDARMSGTSYGACVLHVAPESFVGGPLAFVRDGDIIELDVPGAAAVAAGRRRGAGAPPRRHGRRARPPIRAASAACTRSTSPRPTAAATSTSSKAPRRSASRRFTRALSSPQLRLYLNALAIQAAKNPKLRILRYSRLESPRSVDAGVGRSAVAAVLEELATPGSQAIPGQLRSCEPGRWARLALHAKAQVLVRCPLAETGSACLRRPAPSTQSEGGN